MELRFLKRGCLQSDNMTTDLYHSGPLRNQSLPLIMPTMLWIETHQSWARFVIHQSLTIMVVLIVWLSKLTLSPDEDLQCVVKTSQSRNIKVTIARQMIKLNPLYTCVLYNEWYYSLRYMYAWCMYNVGLCIVSHFVFDWGLLNFILLIFIRWQCWFAKLISPAQ